VLARVALAVVNAAYAIATAVTVSVVAILLTGKNSASTDIHVGYRGTRGREGHDQAARSAAIVLRIVVVI
jgi:hypothetical protein